MFPRDIVNTVRRAYNFSISQRTANRLKVSLADLKTQKKIAGRVAGIDCVAGLPREKVIPSGLINRSVRSGVEEIGQEIRSFLERTPPQIRRNILAEGIYLTGGSTRISHIDQVLTEETGCSILLSKYYDLCTVYGLKEIITHDALHHWAFTPKFRK